MKLKWPPRIVAACFAVVGLSLIGVAQFGVRVDAVLPVPPDQLGLAPNHSELAAPVAAQMPTFFVVGAEDQQNEKKNIRLWEFAKLANGGQHLPNYPQETGDCVSFGAKNACEYFLAAAMGKGLLDSEFHPIFPPYIYGISRVTIGKGRLGNSPGSVGAWAAEGIGQYGVLRADITDVPPYNGRLADEWGRRGVPKPLIEAAKMFTFDSIAPIRSANDARDAICNGYPVTIASDFGTKTIKPRDGRQVAVRNAKWPHQMCLIGFDGTASQPFFYVLNSWGESAHPQPLQGEPPGGFWITQSDCEYIVRQGDSFAFSGFDGFPAQEFVPDFSVIGSAGPPADNVNVAQETVAMFPLDAAYQMPGTVLGVVLCIVALVVALRGNRKGRIVMGAAVMMLAATLPVAAQEFQPEFAIITTSAQGSTSPTNNFGARTANESTAGAAEFAPDFALVAMTANTPHDAGAIRSPVPTEPPAVDFALLVKACRECKCPDCDCTNCTDLACGCSTKDAIARFVVEKTAPDLRPVIKAHTAAWCSTCPLWKAKLGTGDRSLRIDWTDAPPPAGASTLPALVTSDGRMWDWRTMPTLLSLKAWEAGKQPAKVGRWEPRSVRVGRGYQTQMVWVEN